MQHRSANTRYRIIDRCLRDKRNPYPTLAYLIDACSEALDKDSDVGKSTIQHDIQDLRSGRAIPGKRAPIEYDKLEKGYFYYDPHFSLDSLQLEEDEWNSLRYAVAELSRYKGVPIFAHFKSAIDRIDSAFELGLGSGDDKIDQIVQFEAATSTAGNEWIYDIYYAIRESYLIEFRYENIYRKEKRRHRAVPYLLKEFRNRWYMVVWSMEKEKFATYSLDRITELQIVKEPQQKRTDFDASQFFADSVGIFAPGGKPQKVVLHLLAPFDRLVQLDPIHPSQKLLKTPKEGVRIELKVHITPELKNRILSMGPSCKVEAPASLQSEVKSLINSMKKLY
mgnify:FL=1